MKSLIVFAALSLASLGSTRFVGSYDKAGFSELDDKGEKLKNDDARRKMSQDLDFHRLNKRKKFMDEVEELIDKQLTKADPFLDDFVPDEFTGGFSDFHGSPHHASRLMYPGQHVVPKISIIRPRYRRLPRDVDSNVVDEVDVEDSKIEEGEDKQQQRQKFSAVDSQADDLAEDDDVDEGDDDDAVIQVIRNNVTMEMVLLDLANSQQQQTEDDISVASNATSPIPQEALDYLNEIEDVLMEDEEEDYDGDDESIMWLRAQIEELSQRRGLTPADRALLQLLNETLSSYDDTADSRQLLDLTVELVKISQRLDYEAVVVQQEDDDGGDGDDQEETTVQPGDDSGEDSESSTVAPECKDLQKLKILPDDPADEVKRKYGRSMKCYMDETVDPCDDFYKYACGRWGEYHPIPKDKSGYDTFEILREDLHANLINMFEEPASPDDDNTTAAAKLLYNSCMDREAIEARRETPLLRLLEDFGGWPVLEGDDWDGANFSWVQTVRQLRLFNNDILVAIWVGPDGKDSDEFIVQFDQSDLLLPSSDYYKLGFGHPIMQTYYNMVVDVATILGADPARAKREMKDLIDFETELAGIMIPPMMRRNFSEIYKKMSLEKLQEQVPTIEFSYYLEPLLPRRLNDTEDVVIYALPYYQKLTALVSAADPRTVANYVLWRFIRHRINNLDARFEAAQHALYRMLYGREETPPRKRFCVSYVNGNLGNVVGSMFVRRHFDQQSKRDMELLTTEVQDVFRDLVLNGAWLTNATKSLADLKIDNIVHNIGYPDDIVDEEKLQQELDGIFYRQETFFENVLNNLRARTEREMSQLDDRVNRTLWTTTPAVVNAYYSRNRNQIMFPAAILQPPFYHKHFPKAVNYGGIGIVIGHEITHGFDDKGRQFDHLGNIEQWWDLESFQNFRERKRCIIDQYSEYLVQEVNIYLNGENTQGENIADNGGIKQAYYAYKNWLEENNLLEESPLPGLEDLSGDQLFFLNFAQVWCGHTRPEALRSKLKTAVHAPGPYRVLGTLSNSGEFSRAFRCSDGARMNPADKCTVW